MKNAYLLFILIVPISILVFHTFGFYPPILHNSFGDPDYGYLLNSLHILQGKTPVHIDHPGTTLQLWGAVVIRVVYFFQATSHDLVDAVLAGPYVYMYAISYTLAVGLAGAVLALGAVLVAQGNRWWVVLMAQVSPLLLPSAWDYLVHVSAEVVVLTFAVLIAALLLQRGERERMSRNSCFALGALLGLGVATKLNFLPFLLLLFFARGRKNFFAGLAGALVSFLLATIPIWSAYPRVYLWILGLFQAGGSYGMPLPRAVSTQELLVSNFLYLWESSLPFFVLLLLFPLGLLASHFTNDAERRELRLKLLLGAVSVGLLLILVLKQVNPRYLLPSVVVWAWIIPALLNLHLPRIAKVFVAGTVALLLGFSVSQGFSLWHRVSTQLPLNAQMNAELLRKVKEYPQCGLIYTPPAPVPAFALYGGDIAMNGFYTKRLQRLYPNTIFYDLYPGQFRSFLELLPLKEVKRLMSEKSCVILFGSNQILAKNQSMRVGSKTVIVEEIKHPFDLEPLFTGTFMSLFRVVRFHDKAPPQQKRLRGTVL